MDHCLSRPDRNARSNSGLDMPLIAWALPVVHRRCELIHQHMAHSAVPDIGATGSYNCEARPIRGTARSIGSDKRFRLSINRCSAEVVRIAIILRARAPKLLVGAPDR